MRTELQQGAKRVVVKVGTSLLAGAEGGLDLDYLTRLADAVAEERKRGRELALVTSGAIGAGIKPLGLKARPKSLRHLQAAAAVGQVHLVHAYEEAFRRHGYSVGQVLLTRDGLEDRERYLNARSTLLALLEEGAVPVVNENDTVSVEEIRFGDNDTLAALVTKLVDAELLIVLTDVEGLFTSDPRKGDAEFIGEVAEVTDEMERSASGAGSGLGSGGMVTKLRAAKQVTAGGAGMVLADGRDPSVVGRILAGEAIGTFFRPRKQGLDARRFWIAFGNVRSGAVKIDEGAKQALLERGKSLLPVGVVAVEGEFSVGDTIGVLDEAGREFARGMPSYTSPSVQAIMGRQSKDLPGILGSEYSEDEVIHRDNLVIL